MPGAGGTIIGCRLSFVCVEDGLEAKRVLIFARVSDDHQEPASQVGPLQAIARRKGWQVVETLEIRQGAWKARDSASVWRQVTEAIHRCTPDILMVWSLDRLTREGIESAFQKLNYLEQHLGVEFYSLQESFLSTASADRSQRELMVTLMAWAAKWESIRRSERLKAKAHQRRMNAEKLGARARWGRGRMPTPRDIAAFQEMRAKGMYYKDIARATGFGHATVYRAINKNTRKTPGGQ